MASSMWRNLVLKNEISRELKENEFIQSKSDVIQLKQQQLEFQEQQHRDEIIKFQTEVGDLKNELCLSQNEIYKLKVNKYSKLETASCRDLNKISDPEETPRLGMKRKKCCKDLLAIALDVEKRKSQTCKFFYKWRSLYNAKQISRLLGQVSELKMKLQRVIAEDETNADIIRQQLKKLQKMEPILVEDDDDTDANDIQQQEKTSYQIRRNDFRCDICRKCFSTQGELLKHMITHDQHHLLKKEFDKKSVNGMRKTDHSTEMIATNGATLHGTVPFDVNTHNISMPGSLHFSSITGHGASTFGTEKNAIVVKQEVTLQNRGCSKQLSSKRILNKHSQESQKQRLGRKLPTARQRTVIKTGHAENSTSNSLIGSNGFRCDRCQKQFKTKTSLNSHQVLVHLKYSRHQCVKCDKYLPSASSLRDHMAFHEGTRAFKCAHCQRNFFTKSNLRAHLKTHLKTDTAVQQKDFGEKISHPMEEKYFRCKICSKLFSSEENLYQHVIMHNEPNQFKCEFCQRKFTQKPLLDEHMKLYHPPACGDPENRTQEIDNSKEMMGIHDAVVHDQLSQSLPNVKMEANRSLMFVDPRNNNEEMIVPQETVSHVAAPFDGNVHGTVSNAWVDTNNTFVDEHVMIHDPLTTLQNREDSKQFSYKRLLNELYQKDTAGRKPISTTVSPHASEREHADSGTSSDVMYQCDRCPKQFKTKWSLFQHQVFMHNKSSKHQCRKCNKYFPSASHLVSHMASHEGTADSNEELSNPQCPMDVVLKAEGISLTGFQCDRCPKLFETKWSLFQHQVFMHNRSSKYQCLKCNKYFPSGSHLKSHMLSHQRSKILQDESHV